MSLNRSCVIGAVCLLAVLGGFGCDDNDDANDRPDRLGPSPISFNGTGEPAVNSLDFFAHGVNLQPAVTTPQPVSGSSCPERPPLQIPFVIVGSGGGSSDLFINEVQMRFVDRAGIVGGAMTMNGGDLAQRFGNTRLPASGTRSFPLTLPFGCVGSALGTLEVFVISGNSSSERAVQTALSLDVR